MLKTFSLTDIGKKRKDNQDYIFSSENPVGNLPNLFIVADGMGGHKAGDYASKLTVETMVEYISGSEEKNPSKLFYDAICNANSLIRETAEKSPDLEGMGTTVVACTCLGQFLQIANVGDSRLYVVGKTIRQITKDHSLVAEMVRMGGLLAGDAKTHPDKNIITRAVGASEKIVPDFFSVELEEDDSVLMCTDGLTNMLEDEEIRMLLQSGRDIVEKVQSLIDAANKAGGVDNISVILLETAL